MYFIVEKYLLQIACTSSQSDKVFLFDIGYVSSAPTEVSPLCVVPHKCFTFLLKENMSAVGLH
jgi:hypothetical protein